MLKKTLVPFAFFAALAFALLAALGGAGYAVSAVAAHSAVACYDGGCSPQP